ncbi:hypothetical protein [Acidicapsa ligni]|uniref:hypothetical protein n=1 Tax=Acidicapsa ligni TaxID=542300 RepID=UPI0021E06FC1|nr:hypothetical protein [Acidicapsa ligni]
MSDAFSLSLWYPQFRFASLGEKLELVLRQFASHGGEPGVFSATAWPVNWREAAAFQEIYGLGEHGARIEYAIEEAMELLHADYAYEFQIGWTLWEPDLNGGLHPNWVRTPRLVRVIGYGPEFDEGAFEQEGHIRIDFGTDAPFLQEDVELTPEAIRCIEENVRQLIDLTNAVEKESEASARLIWSELGESLAARLVARLNLNRLQ